jgi:hypothetical protein
MDIFRYRVGERVLVQGTGTVGTVVARQPARVYQVSVSGGDQPSFYAESQLHAAPADQGGEDRQAIPLFSHN